MDRAKDEVWTIKRRHRDRAVTATGWKVCETRYISMRTWKKKYPWFSHFFNQNEYFFARWDKSELFKVTVWKFIEPFSRKVCHCVFDLTNRPRYPRKLSTEKQQAGKTPWSLSLPLDNFGNGTGHSSCLEQGCTCANEGSKKPQDYDQTKNSNRLQI